MRKIIYLIIIAVLVVGFVPTSGGSNFGHLVLGTLNFGTDPNPTSDITFQNGEYITNSTDGEVELSTSTLKVNGNIELTGRVEAQLADHFFSYFEDSSIVIATTAQNTWETISNGDSLFYAIQESDGFDWKTGDTITYNGAAGAHIDFNVVINFTAAVNKDFEFRVYNVSDSSAAFGKSKISGDGNNVVSTVIRAYFMSVEVGDDFILQVRCTTDGSDPTLIDGIWRADVRHY